MQAPIERQLSIFFFFGNDKKMSNIFEMSQNLHRFTFVISYQIIIKIINYKIIKKNPQGSHLKYIG